MITLLFTGGVFSLLLNTIKDLRERMVDDRLNYLMLGSAITYSTLKQTNMYIFWGAVGFCLLLSIVLLKYSSIGLGDVSAFNWITIALSVDSLLGLIYFWLFMGLAIAYTGWRNRKYKVETPFFPLILVGFIMAYLLV